MSQFEPPVPTPRDEAVWLQPFPDALLECVVDVPLGPEARYEQKEVISLAFVTALRVGAVTPRSVPPVPVTRASAVGPRWPRTRGPSS